MRRWGWRRATAEDDFVTENLLAIQKELVILMGELATTPRTWKDM